MANVFGRKIHAEKYSEFHHVCLLTFDKAAHNLSSHNLTELPTLYDALFADEFASTNEKLPSPADAAVSSSTAISDGGDVNHTSPKVKSSKGRASDASHKFCNSCARAKATVMVL